MGDVVEVVSQLNKQLKLLLLLFVVCCLLFVVCCLLFVVCCLLFVVCCLLLIDVCCFFFYCLLFVVRVAVVGCWSLFVLHQSSNISSGCHR